MWDIAKAVLRGKFIVLSALIEKTKFEIDMDTAMFKMDKQGPTL